MRRIGQRDKRRRAASRGIALVSVLWVVALLTVAAGGLSQEARTDTQLARNLLEAAQAREAAAGAVHLTALRLSQAARDPAAWAPRTLRVGEITVRVRLSDEAGKIDLNAAPLELLEGLLRVSGEPEGEAAALAAAILDWRDADDLRMVNGAEDGEYRAAGKAYDAKDSLFTSVDELQLVLGMTPALYARIRPDVTVHSRQTGINPMLASVRVLQAVPGTSPAEAERYVALREERLRENAPPPPPPFGDRRYLSSQSGRAYTVDAQARTPSGALANLSATLQVGRSAGNLPYRIASWELEPPPAPGVREDGGEEAGEEERAL